MPASNPADESAPSSFLDRPRSRWIAAALLFSAVVAIGAWIVEQHPVLFFWDPYERLAYRDQLVVRRWLPGLQLLIHAVSRVTYDVEVLRYVLVITAAAAIVAAYRFGRTLGGELGALLGALWLASNRMFLELATMPYQEILFLAATLAGLAWHARGERGSRRAELAGALCLNLACLTRYEGWIAVAALALDRMWCERSDGWTRPIVRATRTFLQNGGVCMGLWLAWGTFELSQSEASVERRMDLRYFVDMARAYAGFLLRHGGMATLVLGALGWLWALLERPLVPMARRLTVFFALDVAMVLTVDPFSGSRRVFLALVILSLFAGQGVERSARWLGRRFSRPEHRALGTTLQIAVVAGVAAVHVPLSAWAGLKDVERGASEPSLVDAYQAGRWIAEQPAGGAGVVASTAEHVQVLALRTWTAHDVEGDAARWSRIPEPAFVVDLGGARDEITRYLDSLRGRASLELAFEPRGSDGPRVWRVRHE